jgi:hypothetical protein
MLDQSVGTLLAKEMRMAAREQDGFAMREHGLEAD